MGIITIRAKEKGSDNSPRIYSGSDMRWRRLCLGSPEHPSKMFGMEMSLDLEENGRKMTIKLK